MKNKENIVSESILKKVKDVYPNVLNACLGEIQELYQVNIEDSKNDIYLNQFILGYIFTDFNLFDGKNFNLFLQENLDLTVDEKTFLENVSKAIFGYFDVISIEKNLVKLRDKITKKEYEVETVNLNGLFVGDIIEAKLVKNFSNKLHFFGAMIRHNHEKEEIEKTIKYFFEK